jgi:hypothetical protein
MRISAIWLSSFSMGRVEAVLPELLGLTPTHCDVAAGFCAFATGGGPPLVLIRQPARPTGPGGGAVITFDCPGLPDLPERVRWKWRGPPSPAPVLAWPNAARTPPTRPVGSRLHGWRAQPDPHGERLRAAAGRPRVPTQWVVAAENSRGEPNEPA